MKTAIIILLINLTMAISAPVDYYVSLLSADEAQKGFTNKESLKMYTDCFLDKGPCDGVGERIRKIVPDLIETACARCTDIHKRNTRLYFEVLSKMYPEDVTNIIKKYDPEQKYIAALTAAIRDA